MTKPRTLEAIQHRKAELDGLLKGSKRDDSPEGRAEYAELTLAGERAGKRNLKRALSARNNTPAKRRKRGLSHA